MSKDPSDVHQMLLEASLAGDAEKIMPMFDDEAVLMPPNDTSLYGKAEIRAWWEEYFQHFRITSSIETERDTHVSGNLAFERRAASVTIVPKQRGARIRDEVRSLVVWKKEAGTWKITRFIWNSVKPVGAGTNRFMTRMLEKKPRA